MSYCVNCGVELADSEKECPLCGTEVVNPRAKWKDDERRPYPTRIDAVVRKVNRKFVVLLICALMLIPIVIPVLTDMLFNRGITWSAYVVGADVCLFFLCVFPFLYEVPRPYLYLAIDTAVLVGYIALIAYNSGGGWFLPLGLPLMLCLCATVSAFIFVIRRSRLSGLKKAAILFGVAAAACVVIDCTISRFAGAEHPVLWSLFVVGSNIVFSAIMLILDKRKELRDEILRRLFI
ncbi:MAG: zinc ribbon domain-containing protein [Oscillospiraceae bacterium]|nr:zinc ribbon domain-containing protein [Oscillospiraceae bacterium]